MASVRRMRDMERSPEEKFAAIPSPAQNDYPYGLCISLTEQELEKLDLEPDCEVGDMIHGFFMAKVTSVSKNDVDGKKTCRVELQITHLGLEDEDMEWEEEEKAEAAE